MAGCFTLLLHCFSIFLIFAQNFSHVLADGDDRKLHIVYMGSLPKEKYLASSQHRSLLREVISSSPAENLLVRSYRKSFNGFAAKLFDSEAKKLASSDEVVSVFPSRTYQLQTTRSWSFMGFNETTPRYPTTESNVTVGHLDSGIWPESESFNDDGFGPPPKKWKGTCKGGQNFTCNNKIIGARYYTAFDQKVNTARDDDGHGTHTASTVAGNKVKHVSFFGLAGGTARGGVPSARIAACKVCQPTGCSGADILAAFDDAIADGVNIITLSVGSVAAFDYPRDEIAIGAFHAMEKGILTSHAAGNFGPHLGHVSSVAPWILSVAAGSIDRQIIDKVILGNGMELIGNSVNSYDEKGEYFPLINGTKAKTNNCSELLASTCWDHCLNSSLVKGKIVLCNGGLGDLEAIRAGASGAILNNEDVSDVVPLPALSINNERFSALESYMKSTKILKSEAIKDSTAPLVASFSSRGPNKVVGDLLKPDIVAPGVDIIAAYPPVISPTYTAQDRRKVKYNILSGTSMSCPHAAGVAAYVKTFHPNWSISAIKSAIMTTAFSMNPTANSGAEFAYGSGHINPLGAIHPGLVYDAEKADYITFLCSLGYCENLVRRIAGDNNTTCPHGAKKASPRNLNYPSMTARVPPRKHFAISFIRTVTNVGFAKSIYKAKVSSLSNLKIKVVPEVLSLKSINEKKSFSLTVNGVGLTEDQMVSASLIWSDDSHIVRSPIVVHTYKTMHA